MFSSRTGECQAYNALANLATPFVKRDCFEPCFLTPMNDSNSDTPKTFYDSHLNIKNNDRSCGFDTAYGSGISNAINPLQPSNFDSRNSLWRRENSVVVGNAPLDYATESGQTCPQQPLYVVDETNTVKVICPILDSLSVQPQCKTCMTTVFQCQRFKELDPVAYQKCNEYKRMIHYDIITPNGSFIPLGVEMTDTAFAAYHAAVQKCGFICGSCQVNYDSMNFKPPVCTAPAYTV